MVYELLPFEFLLIKPTEIQKDIYDIKRWGGGAEHKSYGIEIKELDKHGPHDLPKVGSCVLEE